MVTSLTFFAKCNSIGLCLSGLPNPNGAQNGSIVTTLISLAIGITAALSVLFVAIGGLRYVLSQGDPQGVSRAKSTIIYALIGLAVAVIAQGIVVLAVKVIA